MKKYFLYMLSILLFVFSSCGSAFSQTIDKETLWGENSTMTFIMYRAYNTDKQIVMTLGKLLENDDDVSVCLYLAGKTQIHPQNIMGLKRANQSWKQIIKSISFEPSTIFTDAGIYDIFGVPHIFRHSYGEYKKWQKDANYQMDLTDDDFRDLVQLRFVTQNYGASMITVMRKRNAGESWTNMILSGGR